MKNKFTQLRRTALAGLALAASVGAAQASSFLISSFDTGLPSGIYNQNWNGSTPTQSWNSSQDAAGSPTSGSMEIKCPFDNVSQNGGVVVIPANDLNATGYTALEYDAKVVPGSSLDQFGTSSDFKVGVQTGSGYVFYALDRNLNPVATNNGWQHVVVPTATFAGLGDVKTITIQQYDNNYTALATNDVLIDNIQFTGPNPTYPNYTMFTFDNTNFLGQVFSNWYGHPVNVIWTTNDAQGNPNSGSMEIIADMTTGDNCDVVGLWQGTNGTFPGALDTNAINGTHYSAVELDVWWDTNLSTISIDQFNSLGDISGMPVGIVTPTGSQIEAMGAAAPAIPDAASNGWVHMKIPINTATAGINPLDGIWFKKYNGNPAIPGGTAAYRVDNIVFDGAPIAVSQPTMALTVPKAGLHILNNSGGPYDRESLETFATDFSFMDQSTPMTYSMNLVTFPDTNHGAYDARIYLVPNGAATEAEPDYTEASLIMIDIARNANNTATTTLRVKTNNPGANGDLYDGGLPNFTASGVLGTWSYTFTSDTTIHVTAPDGTSTDWTMPLSLTTADMETYFGTGQMVVYFGGYNNGSANVGQYVTIGNDTISQGATTLLTDNFVTDTVLDINTGLGSSGIWSYASDSSVPADAIFLLEPTTKYYIDWSVPAPNFFLETNNVLNNAAGWGTNTGVTPVQQGDHFHTEFGTTNLPAGGNVFFRVENTVGP